VARGVAGRPANETPALDGASRAHIECDINVDSLAYWNDPQGTRDLSFKSPFAVEVYLMNEFTRTQADVYVAHTDVLLLAGPYKVHFIRSRSRRLE
jgi:hypothetical protein